jgi:hypothetical protein
LGLLITMRLYSRPRFPLYGWGLLVGWWWIVSWGCFNGIRGSKAWGWLGVLPNTIGVSLFPLW